MSIAFVRSLSWLSCTALALISVVPLQAQNEQALSSFFEGKQVIVRLDMPGTQQGVDVYPQRPQGLDLKSYAGRMKKFGTAIRNGDSVLVTKVKIKDKTIEFQLAGGGYGTPMDDTDTSVHYTPLDKSNREKDLQDEISRETDPSRRRALQRQLDDLRARRERQNRRDQTVAQEAADSKSQQVFARRQEGGSRFNLRFNTAQEAATATPEQVLSALGPYLTFPGATLGTSSSSSEPAPLMNPSGPPPPPQPAGDPHNLKKGMSFEQVVGMFGEPVGSKDNSHDGLKVTAYTFATPDSRIETSFVNGVLVQYTVSSR